MRYLAEEFVLFVVLVISMGGMLVAVGDPIIFVAGISSVVVGKFVVADRLLQPTRPPLSLFEAESSATTELRSNIQKPALPRAA